MEREGIVVSASSSAAQATVLLLGWEGAKAAPLMACARLYKELGFHIIAASAEFGEEDRRRAPLVLSGLIQNQFDSLPLVVHVIGRGGMAIWTRLRATMEAVEETRHVLARVRALVVDSAPWSVLESLNHRKVSDENFRTAVVYALTIVWFLLKEIFGTIPVLRTIFGIRKYRSKVQHLSNKEVLTMPCQSLYLYGGEDSLADTSYIRRFIRELNEAPRSPPPSPSAALSTSSPTGHDDEDDYDELNEFAPFPSLERSKESPRRVSAPTTPRGVIYERCWPNCAEPGPRHASRICASEYVETLAQFLERCDLVPRLTQAWPRFADSL